MNRRQWHVAVAGFVAVLGVWLLAASLTQFQFQDGAFLFRFEREPNVSSSSPNGPPDAPLPAWLKVAFMVLVWVVFPLSVVALILKPRLIKTVLMRAAVMALWALFIFAMARVANQLVGLWGNDVSHVLSENTETGLDPNALPDPSTIDTPWWLQWVASLLAVLLGVWAFYKLRPVLAPRASTYDLEAELSAQAGQAARALRQGAPLDDVVVRCYQQMCELLATRQRRTPEALTPREFERELQLVGISDPHITKLSRLFERVRYGAHPAMSEDEKEALSCLEGIEKRYRRSG